MKTELPQTTLAFERKYLALDSLILFFRVPGKMAFRKQNFKIPVSPFPSRFLSVITCHVHRAGPLSLRQALLGYVVLRKNTSCLIAEGWDVGFFCSSPLAHG